jgi:hypothetical protein
MTKPSIERRIVFGAFRRERVSRKWAWGTADVLVGALMTIAAQAELCAISAMRRHPPLSSIRTREFGIGPEKQSIFELNFCNDTPITDLRRIIKF